MGGTVDVFGRFESQIQQRSDFFLSGLAAEPTDQPDMSDQKSGTPLAWAEVSNQTAMGIYFIHRLVIEGRQLGIETTVNIA